MRLVMKVVSRMRPIWLLKPAALIVEVTTAGPVGIATGVLLLIVVVVSAGATGSVERIRSQLAKLPPSTAEV